MYKKFRQFIEICLGVIWILVFYNQWNINHTPYRETQFAGDFQLIMAPIVEMVISLVGIIVSTTKKERLTFITLMILSFLIPIGIFILFVFG